MLKRILMSVLESPLYIQGSWDDSEEVQSFEKNTVLNVFLKNKKLIYKLYYKKLNKTILWYYKNEKIYIGFIYTDKEDVERFNQIGYVQLKRNKVIEKLKKEYAPLYEVSEIFIDEEYRGYGIGEMTYLLILTELKFNVMSDEIQYSGPKKIYSRLSNSEYICADIINIKTKEIIKENHCIYFNPKDELDFDELAWDMKDYNKMDTRIILYLKEK